MNIDKQYKLVYECNLLKKDNIYISPVNGFSRVLYYIELQSRKYGNQWITTEFDAFSTDINDYYIPKKIIQKPINNLSIKSSNGYIADDLSNGFIEFTPYNYAPGENKYDTIDNLQELEYEGNYGCMQVHSGTNVIWAYNAHNYEVSDVGIGSNIENCNKDWTFMQNSKDYTIANLKVFSVNNEITFGKKISNTQIDLTGVINGDPIIFDSELNKLTQTRIPYIANGNILKPNFIIALTGQSNSQGYKSLYDSDNQFDQPHERIFGFNSSSQEWENADLNTESTGSFWHKPSGDQSLAFHFAKRLVEAYPDIRPGIINLGVSGQAIARWAKFPEDHKWYQTNADRAAGAGVIPGDIYDLHVEKISQALEQLDNEHKKIDVICWHQGESDGWTTDSNYYTDSLNQVISQYRVIEYCSSKTPFIVGETTGADVGTDQGWESRNVQLRNLNLDADPYTKCVSCADLETSHGQYRNGDQIHFSANAQRKMGTRYFRAFRSIFDDF